MLAAFLAFGALALGGMEVWADRFAWPVDPSWYRLTETDGAVTFGCQNFAPVRFTAAPPQGTSRIVLLGGSAAFGFPDRPVGEAPLAGAAHGIGGALQATLDAEWPGRFEVVNLAVNGGTSEDTLRLARRAMAWGPAALVVYDGNNEFMDVPRQMSPRLWRFALYRRASVLRERTTAAPGWVGPPAWTSDEAAAAVVSRLRRDLTAVVGLGAGAGIPVVLSTQATNLADFDPSWSTTGEEATIRSLPTRSDAEVTMLYAATPDSADLAWADGQRRLRAGTGASEAASALQAAVDHDAMAFRPTSTVNATIRAVAAEEGAVLADADAAVRAASERAGVPGEAELYDWVHPRPGAAATIAGALLAGLAEAHAIPGAPPQLKAAPELPAGERGARDVRVAVSWVQWACVRAHDPGFRLAKADQWAAAALAEEPGNELAQGLLQVSALLAERSAKLDSPLPGSVETKLRSIHACVAARLGG